MRRGLVCLLNKYIMIRIKAVFSVSTHKIFLKCTFHCEIKKKKETTYWIDEARTPISARVGVIAHAFNL